MLQRSAGLLIFVIAITIFSNIAIACTPPDIPSCYSRNAGGSNTPGYDICRSQIQVYQDRGNSFLQCLQNDLNRAANDADRAAQDYNSKKNVYDTAAQNLNRAVNELNQANAEYQQHVQNYEEASGYIQEVLDAIIDSFNQMFSG